MPASFLCLANPVALRPVVYHLPKRIDGLAGKFLVETGRHGLLIITHSQHELRIVGVGAERVVAQYALKLGGGQGILLAAIVRLAEAEFRIVDELTAGEIKDDFLKFLGGLQAVFLGEQLLGQKIAVLRVQVDADPMRAASGAQPQTEAEEDEAGRMIACSAVLQKGNR